MNRWARIIMNSILDKLLCHEMKGISCVTLTKPHTYKAHMFFTALYACMRDDHVTSYVMHMEMQAHELKIFL